MKNLIVIMVTMLITFQVQAARCVEEFITLKKEEQSLSARCDINRELELDYTYKIYPNLRDNPYKVRYWNGGYVRKIITTSYYLRELVNNCWGSIISSSEFETKTSEDVYFDIVNPNLHYSVSQTYMLAPLTEEEANIEMVNALTECEGFEL